MGNLWGIIFALIALLAWAGGDFYIQKTTRLVGSWRALFYIGILGLVVLFPWVKNEAMGIFNNPDSLLLLTILTLVTIFVALFDFEALRQGKLAIVEPILGIELPITVGLSMALAGERLGAIELLLVAVVFVGIVLAITKHHTHLHYHKRLFEKGVILAGIGAVGMALVNFLVGTASQKISPLATIWFVHSLIAVVCFLYLLFKGELRSLVTDMKNYSSFIIAQSVFDNAAWIAYAFATTLIPIAIATTISESYIALAVLLGIFVNRERLRPHQIVGIVLAIAGVLGLSLIVG